MLVGEMTITLQDVAILFGLRVHGHPVTGTIVLIGMHFVRSYWVIETDIHRASLKVLFITTHLSHLPPKVLDGVMLQLHARAYILLLMGSSLFPYKKETYLQLVILLMLRDFDETT